MTNQTVTAQELMAERPEMVESIIDLIIADTISYLVEDDETYLHLRSLFIQPQQDIVQLYKQVMEPVDYLFFAVDLMPLVRQVIDNIGADLFTDMLDTNQSNALSEVLRCFGHGVSFWDSWDYKLFGFKEDPKLKTTLEQPWDIATQILDKINEAYPEYQPNEDEGDNDFDKWLAENYTPAGEDASSGEQWFLSNSPHEFMPISLSKLKEQYNLDNEIEDDEEEDGSDNVTTFQIPEHYLSLIFNGDASGYEEEEIKAWAEFERGMIANGFTNGHWSYPDNQEAYTTWSNDVTNVGDTVIDLQWVDMSN